ERRAAAKLALVIEMGGDCPVGDADNGGAHGVDNERVTAAILRILNRGSHPAPEAGAKDRSIYRNAANSSSAGATVHDGKCRCRACQAGPRGTVSQTARMRWRSLWRQVPASRQPWDRPPRQSQRVAPHWRRAS